MQYECISAARAVGFGNHGSLVMGETQHKEQQRVFSVTTVKKRVVSRTGRALLATFVMAGARLSHRVR